MFVYKSLQIYVLHKSMMSATLMQAHVFLPDGSANVVCLKHVFYKAGLTWM